MQEKCTETLHHRRIGEAWKSIYTANIRCDIFFIYFLIFYRRISTDYYGFVLCTCGSDRYRVVSGPRSPACLPARPLKLHCVSPVMVIQSDGFVTTVWVLQSTKDCESSILFRTLSITNSILTGHVSICIFLIRDPKKHHHTTSFTR